MGAGGFGATSTDAALSTTLVESQALISQLQLQMDQQQLQLDELRQRVLWTFPEVESSLEFLNTPVVSSSVTNVNPVADRPGLIRGSATQAQQDGEGGRGEGGQGNIGLSIHHAALVCVLCIRVRNSLGQTGMGPICKHRSDFPAGSS